MFKRNSVMAVTLVLVSIVLTLALPSCSSKGSTEGPPGDSVISGELKGLRKHSSGYSYQVDFLVESSKDVDTLPNPTKDKVGKVITAETNDNLRELDVGEDFTANVKLVYDAAKTGTIFYAYNVKESK